MEAAHSDGAYHGRLMRRLPRALLAPLLTAALTAGVIGAPAHANEVSPTPSPSASDTVIERGPGGMQLSEKGVQVNLEPNAQPLPDVFARTWVLADATTGEILAAKKAHVQRPPASTLKTLTALTLLPNLDPNARIRATKKAANIYGSRVGLKAGKNYTVDDLFYALMLPSGNDAAIALAQANGGVKETVAQMNSVAQSLQAENTVAKNTSGLDLPGQVSTAYDLALIARAGLARDDFREYVSTKRTKFPDVKKGRKTIYNSNRLLTSGYKGALGVKTGYTTKAGRTFVGAAERNGQTLIVALLGIKETTAGAAEKLLDWGFANSDKVTPIGQLVEPTDPTLTTRSSSEFLEGGTADSGPGDTITSVEAAPVAEPEPSSTPIGVWGWPLLVLFTLAFIIVSWRNRRRSRLR